MFPSSDGIPGHGAGATDGTALPTGHESIGPANEFPVPFALKYFPEQIDVQQIYALRVAIRDGGGSLIYEPQLPIPVVPMGDERTMFVDIAMKEVTSGVQRRRWPELLGMNGEEAVGVIKKETGLTNVLTLPDDAPVTLDYRTDRVRVFIDGKGLVSQMPYIA